MPAVPGARLDVPVGFRTVGPGGRRSPPPASLGAALLGRSWQFTRPCDSASGRFVFLQPGPMLDSCPTGIETRCASESQTLRASAILAALVAAVCRFCPTCQKLVHDWLHDDNYSHGILIVPLALYFSWERRAALLALRPEPSMAGLLVVLGSLGLLVAGTLGAELFLTRVSIVGTLVGSIVFCAGWAYLRVLAFPLAFLLLMIPIPAIIFNQIAFPLQIFASRFGTAVMQTFGVPVLREGNVWCWRTRHSRWPRRAAAYGR